MSIFCARDKNDPHALDIGEIKRLRIFCVSETGWHDTATVFDDIRAAGGAQTDQYAIPWPPFCPLHAENAAGFSALLEAQTSDGSVRRLLDAQRDQIVNALISYGIAKMACNHCTGRVAVEKMLGSGLPVLRGTARYGSQTDLFLGNGDMLELG